MFGRGTFHHTFNIWYLNKINTLQINKLRGQRARLDTTAASWRNFAKMRAASHFYTTFLHQNDQSMIQSTLLITPSIFHYINVTVFISILLPTNVDQICNQHTTYHINMHTFLNTILRKCQQLINYQNPMIQ